jgi:hypothetical protein
MAFMDIAEPNERKMGLLETDRIPANLREQEHQTITPRLATSGHCGYYTGSQCLSKTSKASSA